ncbi:hypothetical protein SAMN04487972_10928 [Paracoccus halophilus]|uniref:Tat pathway signal protein n=1 Tax=Paracoccus halophilus TaxID=376733 RepID=A0A099F231_9RHOB|nr:hypothetical protein [Paracoccus halophilus]KGJ04227.1 hypothetical protein IT41_11070 [Paracoccus halophilus]SFA51976.1 hypothetical protein SAMN04487972_10928 [Paracoccus halophilus]
MSRNFGMLLVSLSLAVAAPLGAQETAAPAGKVMLELNGAVDTETGACRLTVVTTNRLDQAIQRAAWQVAIFDRQGVVQSLPILDFGGMIAGKTKVAMFELPERKCADIGRIVVNDVAECSGPDNTDLRDICLGGLATQTRTDIDFGL